MDSFERGLGARSMDPVVRRLRARVFDIVDAEIALLGQDPISPEKAARALRHLAARLVHNPTVMARKAGEEGQQERYLEALSVVLGIDEAVSVCPAHARNRNAVHGQQAPHHCEARTSPLRTLGA